MIKKFIIESTNPGKICFDSFCDKVCDMVNKKADALIDSLVNKTKNLIKK